MKLLFLILGLFISTAYAKEPPTEPPKIGNFALSSSQQPSPLISFGQNIIDKNQTQITLQAENLSGAGQHFVNAGPSILYGITDDFSIYANLPVAVSYHQSNSHSSGLEDIDLQIEKVFYAKETYTFTDQATIVFNTSFPTGSAEKQPPTGLGSESFLLGGTFCRMYIDWFFFASTGEIFVTKHHQTKYGDQFLYQFGFGRNIANINNWILAWLVETTGQYSKYDSIEGLRDPDSGGNLIFITPSLWASSQKLIFQFGVGLPVVQNLHGNQPKNSYLMAANMSWTF